MKRVVYLVKASNILHGFVGKFRPADGGDGGDGGNVIIRASSK